MSPIIARRSYRFEFRSSRSRAQRHCFRRVREEGAGESRCGAHSIRGERRPYARSSLSRPKAVLFERTRYDPSGCCAEDSLALSYPLVRLITTEAWSARRWQRPAPERKAVYWSRRDRQDAITGYGLRGCGGSRGQGVMGRARLAFGARSRLHNLLGYYPQHDHVYLGRRHLDEYADQNP